jgi:hypothetical protein
MIEYVHKLSLGLFTTALDAKFSNRQLCKLRIVELYSYSWREFLKIGFVLLGLNPEPVA